MGACNHTSWLSLHARSQRFLQQTSLLHNINSVLENPAQKKPSLVVMIGQSSKAPLMTRALPKTRKNVSCETQKMMVHLQLEPDTAFSDRPVFIAQGNIPNDITPDSEPATFPCHESTTHELEWRDVRPVEVLNALYCRLIRPFAELICVFVPEKGDLRNVVEILSVWSKFGQRDPCRSMISPSLLIVMASNESRSPDSIRAQLFKLLEKQSAHDYRDLFSCISIYVEKFTHQTLKDRIRSETDVIRLQRERNHTLFNAIHLSHYFSHACKHFASASLQPFDFLVTSRLHRPVSENLASYLTELLTHVDSYEELRDNVTPMIAESFALDNYSSDVHYFDPQEVFSAHYKPACLAAAGNKELNCSRSGVQTVLLRDGFIRMVERHFITRSKSYCSSQRSRADFLSEFGPWLSDLRTYRFCSPCLRQAPEHKFPCNHMLCEECCVEIGENSDRDPHLYVFGECPICQETCDVQIRVKPITAGARVLSIDGGGIRAVIPIQFLRALEQAIGIDMPVQEHFEFSYGTSSGSIVNLALFGLGMRVDEVYKLFRELSHRVFRGRVRFGVGFAAAAHSLIASYLNGRFPAEDIDGPMNEIFGNTTMSEHPYMSSIGARIGFPVVDVDSNQTVRTCIVTSYNGAGKQQSHDGTDHQVTYRVISAEGPYDDLCIKDAARCASAAPWYFVPHKIPYHGTFMDGGVSYNNPSPLLLSELQRVMPHFRRPDQLISLGTGSCKVRNSEKKQTTSRLFFSNGSVHQALQHCMDHYFDGDRVFHDMCRAMRAALPNNDASDLGTRFSRFNLPLQTELPDLADAQSMDALSEAAWERFAANTAIQNLAEAIIASSFYVELRSMPIFENGGYTCYGLILCRVPISKPAFKSLMLKLESMSARFLVAKGPHQIKQTAGLMYNRAGNFSKPISFRVPSLDEPIDIRLELHNKSSYHTSASPFTIRSLITLQRLEWIGLRFTALRGRNRVVKKRSALDCNRYPKRRRTENLLSKSIQWHAMREFAERHIVSHVHQCGSRHTPRRYIIRSTLLFDSII